MLSFFALTDRGLVEDANGVELFGELLICSLVAAVWRNMRGRGVTSAVLAMRSAQRLAFR